MWMRPDGAMANISRNRTYWRAALGLGDPLREEADLLARSTLAEDGRRVYRLPEFPDEELEEDQLGENFVSEIYRRFTGMALLTDEALGRVTMLGFAPRPWWKFWAT